MNEKGNILLIILGAFLVLLLIPILLTTVFWQVKLIAQIIFIFIIYSTVRGFMGPGSISLIISAVLIYFLVFKYFEIALSLYIFQLLLGLQFLSVVVWGLGTRLRPPHAG